MKYLFKAEHKYVNTVRHDVIDIQRNPFKYVLTQTEVINAYAFLPKAFLGFTIGSLWAAYHLRRHNQMGRLLRLSISGDMVFNVYWRVAVGFIVGERIGA